jgi:hypothetical protein
LSNVLAADGITSTIDVLELDHRVDFLAIRVAGRTPATGWSSSLIAALMSSAIATPIGLLGRVDVDEHGVPALVDPATQLVGGVVGALVADGDRDGVVGRASRRPPAARSRAA